MGLHTTPNAKPGANTDITSLGAITRLSPASDSTTAIKITKADGTTAILTFDTTNKQVYINSSSPAYLTDDGSGGIKVFGGYLFLSNSGGTALYSAGNSFFRGTIADDSNATFQINGGITAGRTFFNGPMKMKGYTVATLPTGSVGDHAYVTDALAPTFLATVVGGGAVITPVFYNGTNWVGS